jgi:hypothetical protein
MKRVYEHNPEVAIHRFQLNNFKLQNFILPKSLNITIKIRGSATVILRNLL